MLGWSAYVTNGGDRNRNFPAGEYVALRLTLERSEFDAVSPEQFDAVYRKQLRTTYAELARRISVEPAIAGATYGTRLPGMNFREMFVEIEGRQATTPAYGQFLHSGFVAVNYFDTFNSSLVAGRPFSDADLATNSNVAIVDQTFVTTILKGQDAVGRHVREMPQEGKAPGPWLEIVGVVTDLTDPTNKRPGESLLFRPAAAETAVPLYMAVRARTNVAAVMSRLRVIAGEVDPSARLTEKMTLDAVGEADLVALDFFARLMAGVSIVAMLLATAGVYALMSFTVARRTAEIGIRVALGANPRRIVTATFARAFTQVTIGLVLGGIPAAAIVAAIGPEVAATNGREVAIWTGAVSVLLVAMVTALACIFPARRALRIQPSDALKTT